jgi:hypothetical protein
MWSLGISKIVVLDGSIGGASGRRLVPPASSIAKGSIREKAPEDRGLSLMVRKWAVLYIGT